MVAHHPQGNREPQKVSQQGTGVTHEQIWQISGGEGGGLHGLCEKVRDDAVSLCKGHPGGRGEETCALGLAVPTE